MKAEKFSNESYFVADNESMKFLILYSRHFSLTYSEICVNYQEDLNR